MGRPLERFFLGDPSLSRVHGKKAALHSVFHANRYRADDGVLAFEVMLKSGEKWHHSFVSGAKATTDIPITTIDFISQRRRRVNPAFSALLYSFCMLWKLPQSDHNILRLSLFLVQLLHNVVGFVVAWFSLAGYLSTLFIINDLTGNPPADSTASGFPFRAATPIVNAVAQVVYIFTLAYQFILGLGTRPNTHPYSYTVSFTIFAILQAYFLMNLLYLVVKLVSFRLGKAGGEGFAY